MRLPKRGLDAERDTRSTGLVSRFSTCRVCRSSFAPYVQDIYLQRQKRSVKQYYCMVCESFFHTSGYVETEAQLSNDLAWLLGNPGSHANLVGALSRIFPEATSCYEIGCGAGSLLAELRSAGYAVSGIEPNPFAVRHVFDAYGIDVQEGLFDGVGLRADIVIAIDVLEHVPEPRQFFHAMIGATTPGGGIALRVPTIDRHQWRFLLDAGHDRPFALDDPFCDASVHITNFSTKGLVTLSDSFGWMTEDVVDNVFMLRRKPRRPAAEPLPRTFRSVARLVASRLAGRRSAPSSTRPVHETVDHPGTVS